MIEELFFALVQVSIGVRDRLFKSPSDVEWSQLYSMAEKQSLVGICFVGIERLPNEQHPYLDLLMDWLGQTEYIKTRNEEVNQHCIEIQKRFTKDGFKSCILKGQGVGSLYKLRDESIEFRDLSAYRNSGDIDILVSAKQSVVLKYLCKNESDLDWDYLHAHYHVFDDTEVEVHYRPCVLYNLRRNKILYKWLEANLNMQEASLPQGPITVPSAKYNKVFLLVHAYHHLLNGGIGLRQMMDYYFVLKSKETSSEEKEEINRLFQKLGLTRFEAAVMWVMGKVFGLEETYCLCTPDEKEGKFLLNEIMQGGNFGHYDTRYDKSSKHNGLAFTLLHKIHTNMHLLTHYTSDVLWIPIYFIWHFTWKRLLLIKYRLI